MSELEDIKLQALLQGMKLETPEPNFSVRVMNKIFEENSALERIKSEKVLGKGFWVIMLLFIALLAIVFLMSSNGANAESQLQTLLPEAGARVSEGYDSFFSKLGGIPVATGAIFIAFSILLFFDRIVNLNSEVFV